jgi:hypothetical protein
LFHFESERPIMTNQQAPEALHHTKYLTAVYRDINPGDEALELIMHPKMTAASWSHVINERDRLQAENANLNAGYAAARLEIESLQARIKTMAEEHADELMVAHLDGRMCGHSTEPAGAQQPGVATWTPLPGTLPEPGKPVLLDIGMEYPIRAMWAAKHTLEVGMEDDSGFGEYDEATDTYYCPEGWYEWNEHEETHWAVDETPTAWCELPPNGGASHGQAPAQAAPAAVAVPSDTFRGDTTCLVQSIIALLELDAEGALVPHGIGGHARALLSAAASRLAAAPTTQPAPTTPQADSVLEDAARWQTFIALPYATRAEWASNLSLAPVLTQWVDAARKQGANHD